MADDIPVKPCRFIDAQGGGDFGKDSFFAFMMTDRRSWVDEINERTRLAEEKADTALRVSLGEVQPAWVVKDGIFQRIFVPILGIGQTPKAALVAANLMEEKE